MSEAFFKQPILNSPYEYPGRHWELDKSQPTQRIIESRRRADLITPIPQPKKRKGSRQTALVFDEGKGLSSEQQQFDHTAVVNAVRDEVDRWRHLPNSSDWRVSNGMDSSPPTNRHLGARLAAVGTSQERGGARNADYSSRRGLGKERL